MAKTKVHKKTIVTETFEKKGPKKKKTSIKKPKKVTRKIIRKRPASSVKNTNLNKMLIENFVSLQKVMTNVSVKYDNLSNQLSKLLNLFEISAKTLAEKDFKPKEENKTNKEIIEKIETLLEQNKIIARGLTLMHERIPGQEFIPLKQISPPQKKESENSNSNNLGEYEKSISIKPQNKTSSI